MQKFFYLCIVVLMNVIMLYRPFVLQLRSLLFF